jgi:hypothetical protein
VDKFVATAAMILSIPCFTYKSEGGADNWVRDIEMVKDADEVIGIVSGKDLEARKLGGTLHVVESALAQEKETRLYTEVEGSLVGVAQQP